MRKHCNPGMMPLKALFLSICLVHCDIGDKLDQGIDQFRIFREQSIFEINSASNRISSGIGDLNSTLEDLGQKLPPEIHKTLSFDVPFIIDAVAGEGISAGLCFTDAATSKALYLLDLMKSEIITGEPVPLPAPFICHTSVSAINLNQDRNQRDILEFTGYNLFLNRGFTASLFNAAGDSLPIPVGRPTNYRVAANISDLDDNTLSQYKELSLFFEGTPISSLFVVKKHEVPPVVKFQNPRVVPGMIAAYPFSFSDDRNFREDCLVSVSISFGNTRKKAWVDMNVIVEELTGDGKTYAVGQSDRNYYYTAPPGWHIKKLDGQRAYDYHSYKDITNEDDVRYPLFGQITIKAKNSIAGATTSALMSFGPNVPDIVLESGD
ncbi:MAG: hypothetical protein LCH81_12445 [Bacteroidetes bacterium]|nr:hypothetical protein [Bacteroidota bacterium]